MARWGGYTVNLLHYEDAASLCVAVSLALKLSAWVHDRPIGSSGTDLCVLQRYCKTHSSVMQLLLPPLALLLLLLRLLMMMMMLGRAASLPHDVFWLEIKQGV